MGIKLSETQKEVLDIIERNSVIHANSEWVNCFGNETISVKALERKGLVRANYYNDGTCSVKLTTPLIVGDAVESVMSQLINRLSKMGESVPLLAPGVEASIREIRKMFSVEV